MKSDTEKEERSTQQEQGQDEVEDRGFVNLLLPPDQNYDKSMEQTAS